MGVAGISERPVLNIAKILAGLIAVIIIVFAVLKPLMRSLVTHGRPILSASSLAADGPAEQLSRGEGGAQPPTPLAYEQQLAQARTLVGQDPKRVAQVIRTWVGQDE